MIAAVLAAPGEAAAAVAEVRGGEIARLQVTDPTGVADAVSVSLMPGRFVVTGAAPGHRCRDEAGATVCPTGIAGAMAVDVDLGGGDDSLVVGERGAGVFVFSESWSGGAGDDTLVGSAGGEVLGGGPGDDELRGGDGDDSLVGGPGSDVIDGGEGVDGIAHPLEPAGVLVDVAAGTVRSGGDLDVLTGIESHGGGPGPDRMIGGPEADSLDGSGGADSIDGGAGDDRLLADGWGAATSAADVVAGGAGDDLISAGESDVVRAGDGDDRIVVGVLARRIACGAGEDELRALGYAGTRIDGCEEVAQDGFALRVPPPGVPWPLAGSISCESGLGIGHCRGTAELRVPGRARPLRRIRIAGRFDRQLPFSLTLRPRDARTLCAGGRSRVAVRFRIPWMLDRFVTVGVRLPALGAGDCVRPR